MDSNSQQYPSLPLFLRLALFSIAMGLLEAIVVVYLRELYFPAGFRFPLQFLPEKMLRLEALREICTIVMLLALSAVAAKTFIPRLSVFLFTFGVWDIFYYVFLKALLGWPDSLLTWDVLFLIPVAWLAPVLAPLITSFTMIGLALLYAFLYQRYGTVRFDRPAWLLMALGVIILFFTFIWDYASIIIQGGFYRDLAGLAHNSAFQATISSFVPAEFHWGLFGFGEALVLASGALVYRKTTAFR
jgi:hypothetical protein